MSHDARLICEAGCELWVVDNKTVFFDGDFEDYRDQLLDEIGVADQGRGGGKTGSQGQGEEAATGREEEAGGACEEGTMKRHAPQA